MRQELRCAIAYGKQRSVMSFLPRFTVSLRLCATVTFLCYLAAGASLTLPSLISCVRCAKQNHYAGMKTGASCPLSYHGQGHDCHGAKDKSSGSIKLCPDGCLRHDGQSGEVTSIAKFLSPPQSTPLVLKPLAQLPPEQSLVIPTRALSPPQHPPSLLA